MGNCPLDSFLFRPLPVNLRILFQVTRFVCGRWRSTYWRLNVGRPDTGEFPEVTLSVEASQKKWKEDSIHTVSNIEVKC